MKMLTLTMTDGRKTMINTDRIEAVMPWRDGSRVLIAGESFDVKESFEELESVIGTVRGANEVVVDRRK